MKRLLNFVMLGCVALLAGCSNMSVSTDYDHSIDFANFKTYAWMQETDGQSYDEQGLMHQRIREAVDQQLKARGMKVDTDNPSLLAVYHTGHQEQLEVDGWGYGYWGAAASAYTYEEGTLIVDLVDAATKKLAWRGTATGAMDDDPSSNEISQNIYAAVQGMFESFPPTK